MRAATRGLGHDLGLVREIVRAQPSLAGEGEDHDETQLVARRWRLADWRHGEAPETFPGGLTMTRGQDLYGEPQDVAIDAGNATLQGDLGIPPGARGVVVFAHASGGSRNNARNRAVAGVIRGRGVATLLVDLLTPEEESDEAVTRHLRFDIELLAGRLAAATRWVSEEPRTRGLRVGYFGASTLAAAALVAAARDPSLVHAVVSRGGRPDLAGRHPSDVRAPTLLLVGGRDGVVADLNRAAYAALCCPKELAIVPGATQSFEEPGALAEVARRAASWFERHLDDSAPATNC